MRTVCWKELRELAVVSLPLLVGVGIAAVEFAGLYPRTWDARSAAAIAGIAVGVAHGLLDRLRRDDLFLRHRPVSSLRLEASRTLAGLITCVLPVVALSLLLRFITWVRLDEIMRFTGYGQSMPEPFALGLVETLRLAGIVAGTWALVRLVIGTRSLTVGFVLFVLLPWAALSVVFRAPSFALATPLLLGLGAVCCLVHVLTLAGDLP